MTISEYGKCPNCGQAGWKTVWVEGKWVRTVICCAEGTHLTPCDKPDWDTGFVRAETGERMSAEHWWEEAMEEI